MAGKDVDGLTCAQHGLGDGEVGDGVAEGCEVAEVFVAGAVSQGGGSGGVETEGVDKAAPDVVGAYFGFKGGDPACYFADRGDGAVLVIGAEPWPASP